MDGEASPRRRPLALAFGRQRDLAAASRARTRSSARRHRLTVDTPRDTGMGMSAASHPLLSSSRSTARDAAAFLYVHTPRSRPHKNRDPISGQKIGLFIVEQTQEIFFFKISEDRVSGARAVREEGESREGGLRATVECFQVPAHRRDRVFKNTFPLRLAPGDGPERRGVGPVSAPKQRLRVGHIHIVRPTRTPPP